MNAPLLPKWGLSARFTLYENALKRTSLSLVKNTNERASYYNLDLSVRLSVPHLLGRLWTDRNETWQDRWRYDSAGAKGIRFHGNQSVAMEI